MAFLRKSTVAAGSRNQSYVTDNNTKWRNRRISRWSGEMFVDDDQDDEDPKTEAMENWSEEFFGRPSVSEDQDIDVFHTPKQTLVLSTLVPDEILQNHLAVGEPRHFVGVVLMADVSGYTALSERYSSLGKGGTYRLTATLNTYLGSLIEVIYSHGGDIIKFAGDAFLALWKTDKKSYLYATIHTVITCALVIQHSYAKYETDVKVNLQVKLAIASGNLLFATIGAETDKTFVILGLPVLEAKQAESVCTSGEVILAATAWAHCFSRNYDHFLHEDGHVTIKSILYDPNEPDVSKPYLGFPALLRTSRKPFTAIESLPDSLWNSTKDLDPADILRKTEALHLRKAILVASEKNIGSKIRKFMIRPVLTQVDAHQPLEFLTEMRQVSILFVTLKPTLCSPGHLITIINNSYQITSEIVYKSMGCVNKIILFDKDVMILVIFGLRGFKHESEAQAALKCAYSVKKSVSALNGVLGVSIGVTTGQVYCGVVGHPLRREFTVIGSIVNKAARLMCKFGNKITCDESTYVKSKMSTNAFILQPCVALKGIDNSGKIYEYTEDIRVKEMFGIQMIPPLLGRNEEMECFESWLDGAQTSHRHFDAFLVIGESRIGKTRLLEWIGRLANLKGYSVCRINLTSIHSANSYLALSQIINQLLGIEEPINGFIKEEKIVKLMHGVNEDFCYLNNIIKVRFAYQELSYTEDEQNNRAKKLISLLISCLPNTYVILLDDLHNLDARSWEFISLILKSQNIFAVFTVTRGKFSAVHTWLYSVFMDNSIRKTILGPLMPAMIPALACQILDVDAVPIDLCNALRVQCKGMPGLVESFIVHLFSTGAIEIVKIIDEELDNYSSEELQFPDPDLLRPKTLNAADQTKLDELMKSNTTGEISICIVTAKEELQTNINVQNLDALIMIQIDSLTPYQQLLLKIASVIGNVCSRELLENIMYENNALTTAKAIKRLFALKILECANGRSSLGNVILRCNCKFDYEPDTENLPKYAFCKVIKFKNKNSRKTCYDLLPMNQKKEFHTRVLNCLENKKHKCAECGDTFMMVHSASTDIQHQQLISGENNDLLSLSISNNFDNDESDESFTLQPSITSSTANPETLHNLDNAQSLFDNQINKETLRSVSILKRRSTEDVNRRSQSKRVAMTNQIVVHQAAEKESPSEHTEEVNGSSMFFEMRTVIEASSNDDWHKLGVVDSDDETEFRENSKLHVTVEQNVSQTDFRKCTCDELNISICEQLVYHAKHADLKVKAIEFNINLSYLNLLADNAYSAIETLQQAEDDLHDKLLEITNFERKRYIARIHSMKAAALLCNGNVSTAKNQFDDAMKTYRKYISKSFPKKLRLKINTKNYKKYEYAMRVDALFCVNVGTLLSVAMKDEKSAKMYAVQALEVVEKNQCNVIDIFEALSNYIEVDLDRGDVNRTFDTDWLVTQVLNKLNRPVGGNELFALGKLYTAMFNLNTAQAHLAAAIRVGYKSLVVGIFLHADAITEETIPDLFYLLMTRRRISETMNLLKLLRKLSKDSKNSENWYYALCLDMILDGGFQLETPLEICRYALFSLASYDNDLLGTGRRRLVVNLWTFWLRVGSERKAKSFETEALSWVGQNDNTLNISALLSALRLSEALLESLSKKVDDLKKVVDLMELRSVADRELVKLEKGCRLMRAVLPRWLMLRASSLNLSRRYTASATMINQSLDEAVRMHNHLEASLAIAVHIDSRVWIYNSQSGNFPNWREGEERAKTSWPYMLHTIISNRENKNITL